MNTGPGGLAIDLAAGVLATAIGSLFAAGDAALSEIPEGRRLALSAPSRGTGAAFRRFTRDPLRVHSRWLVGRVVALSIAAVLFNDAARSLHFDRLALALAVIGTVLTYSPRSAEKRLSTPAASFQTTR